MSKILKADFSNARVGDRVKCLCFGKGKIVHIGDGIITVEFNSDTSTQKHYFLNGSLYNMSISNWEKLNSVLFYDFPDQFPTEEFLKAEAKRPLSDEELKEPKKQSKYHKSYYSMSDDKSITLDVYDLLDGLKLPNSEIEHTLKKIVRSGKGDKDLITDLEEAYTQLRMGIDRIKRGKK